MNEITSFVSDYGFPIAVCAFLLYERYTSMAEFRKSVDANTEVTRELVGVLRRQ